MYTVGMQEKNKQLLFDIAIVFALGVVFYIAMINVGDIKLLKTQLSETSSPEPTIQCIDALMIAPEDRVDIVMRYCGVDGVLY